MCCEKLSVRGAAYACGLIWGGCVLLVGLANMAWAGYGQAFLDLAASIYPGYHASPTLPSVLVGSAYAVLDGGIGGVLFAFLYNLFARSKKD
ncbi:MAG: hypothetical protein JW893_04030 [Candidatus Omnitrophica bacterium]|nr:hypothetical protein [Candidatus Omnitrophota bacterium]